ncbi:MAG: hypothetical protein MMC33_005898 [Icmadophila ericetorum]|nr:hypothetical protein [Icmadophila ericetorum]
MSDFPKLQPAMTVLVSIDAPLGIGSHSKGTPLAIVPMTGGTVVTEPGFEPKLDAEFVGTGNDYIHNDPDNGRMRLDAHGVVKDKSSGSMIYLSYTGIVDITPELGAVLGGSPDAKTTDFGNSFIHMKFETGDPSLKALEQGVFVGAGRFRYENGKPVVVEYKLSKVVKG